MTEETQGQDQGTSGTSTSTAIEIEGEDKAAELMREVASGKALLSRADKPEKDAAIRLSLSGEDAKPFRWDGAASLNPKNVTAADTLKRLRGYKPQMLGMLDVLSIEESEERLAERLEFDQANKKAKYGLSDKPKASANGKATKANPAKPAPTPKVEYPEIPQADDIGVFTDGLDYIKTGKYALANSKYEVRVARNKEKVETYTAYFDGALIEAKSRAHKVIGRLFPYHTNGRRRGYDLDKTGAAITASPNGESTVKKEARPKKEVVVPDGYQQVEGGKLKVGWVVHCLGGNSKRGDVPSEAGGDYAEEVTAINNAAPGHNGQEYKRLTLKMVSGSKKGSERDKFLSTAKKVVAKAGKKPQGSATKKGQAKKNGQRKQPKKATQKEAA